MKGHIRLLSAALLIALAPVARGQTTGDVDSQVGTLDATAANRGQAQVANRIATSFDALAGSHDNSLALVDGLRNGTPITLTSDAPADTTGGTSVGGTSTGGTSTGGTSTGGTSSGGSTGDTTGTTTTTITPPTGKMGWGNVFISLALAKTALANAGITDPTAEQLQAALTGGDVTLADGSTVTMKGVLEMRAEGMGWGRIAQAEGTKLGPVVSSIKSAHRTVALMPSSGSTATGTSTSKRLTTATGSSVTTRGHKGIVTAGGSGAATAGAKGHKGIVTANGASGSLGGAHASKGLVNGSGAAAGAGPRGIVTAEGLASGGSSHGHAYGRGVVTAAGGGAAGLVAVNGAAGRGAGVVTATGASAASAAGVTTAHGGGNGNAHQHGRGKGGG